MKKIIGNSIFYFFSIIFIFIIVCQLGLVPIRFLAVMSGSMSPTINTGDLSIIRLDYKYQPEIGDIVYFDLAGHPTLHRVTEYTQGRITTKGDANDAFDDSILSVNGYYLFRIAFIGYPIHYTQQFFYNLFKLGG